MTQRTFAAHAAQTLARALLVLAGFVFLASAASANPENWRYEWPDTDFTKTSIEWGEILSGGPPKDGIPSIDQPVFSPARDQTQLGDTEPVITLSIGDEVKAYPLRILTWHEIVNDTVGGVPVAVTYCPLCNSAIVFKRVLDGEAVEFGTTGKLQNSNLVMYDRKTESWWQQYTGQAVVGAALGTRLKMLPARVEPFGAFRAAHPDAPVLIPSNPGFRAYGANPYVGYDSSALPFLYRGEMPEGIKPLAYVVVVDDEAWAFDLLARDGRVVRDDLEITWTSGTNSALDRRAIREGRDIGAVTVRRGGRDIPHQVTFAFVFRAFEPQGILHMVDGTLTWSQ